MQQINQMCEEAEKRRLDTYNKSINFFQDYASQTDPEALGLLSDG